MRLLARARVALGSGALALLGCSGFERAVSLGESPASPGTRRADQVGAPSLSRVERIEPPGPRKLEIADGLRRVLGVRPEPSSATRSPEPVAAGEERTPPAPSSVEPAANDPVLVATARETSVYARPSTKAPVVGYLRKGAVVARGADPAGFDGCKGGFYPISPEGFVCVGSAASIDAGHPLARVAARRADRTAALPYFYGRARYPGVPVYSRLPSTDEVTATEPSFRVADARAAARAFDGLPFDEPPGFLLAPAAPEGGPAAPRAPLLRQNAVLRSGFALMSLFEAGGRRYGLTTELSVVPLDALTPVEPSRFHGLPLEHGLPVVFVRSRSHALYSGDPRTTGLRFERRLEFREAVPVTGVKARVASTDYLETSSGQWIVDRDLLRVDPAPHPPPWADAGLRWIDVSIRAQTLVAYEGKEPVFVTLVSTGADGEGDPETTHSTVQGQFRIHTKHVTTTMDSDEAGDEFDLRDVPYVQYFQDGYAFHAVYWHDGFGAPRSHGCVNLSPLDARWLFSWTEPSVPAAWHGAMSHRGTYVSIRP